MARPEDSYARTIGRGIYTSREAADLVGADPQTVARWVSGYRRKPALFERDYQTIDGRRVLSFRDLMEVYFVARLRASGMSLQKIRKFAEQAAQLLDDAHPFSTQKVKLLTDHRTVVLATDAGWIDLSTRQCLMAEILEGYFKCVEFGHDGTACRWWPAGRDVPIVVDPQVAFGAPCIQDAGVSVEVIADFLDAGDKPEIIARMYRLPIDRVIAASDFVKLRRAA